LRGDLHGYIGLQVSSQLAAESPTGSELKISNVLRNLYLVPKPPGQTHQPPFETVSGKSGEQLVPFIYERSVAFAKNWFAKKAVEARGKWGSKGFTAEGALEYVQQEFDEVHAKHNASAAEADKLEQIVKEFVRSLSAPRVWTPRATCATPAATASMHRCTRTSSPCFARALLPSYQRRWCTRGRTCGSPTPGSYTVLTSRRSPSR
jgi:hypothetical protein